MATDDDLLRRADRWIGATRGRGRPMTYGDTLVSQLADALRRAQQAVDPGPAGDPDATLTGCTT